MEYKNVPSGITQSKKNQGTTSYVCYPEFVRGFPLGIYVDRIRHHESVSPSKEQEFFLDSVDFNWFNQKCTVPLCNSWESHEGICAKHFIGVIDFEGPVKHCTDQA